MNLVVWILNDVKGVTLEISGGTREMYHERVTAKGIMPHGKSSPDVVKNFKWSKEMKLVRDTNTSVSTCREYVQERRDNLTEIYCDLLNLLI